jgi:trehalose-phosphatase
MSTLQLRDAFETIPSLRSARKRAGALLVGLDFDGTLAAIVPRPADAVLVAGAADALARLARRPDTVLVIVTGRGVEDARRRVGLAGIHYAGNHGLEIDGPSGSWVHPGALAARAAIDKLYAALLDEIGSWSGVILEKKSVSMSVHFRTVADAAQQARIVECVHATAARVAPALRLGHGKCVVEIRPDTDWDKGKALVALREKLSLMHAPAVFIGDDRTDEDAFREVNHACDVGIFVGRTATADTHATARLADTTDVVRFLDALAENET